MINPIDDEILQQNDFEHEKSQPHIAYLLQDPPSYYDASDSWSTYSIAAEKPEMELTTLRRTRAKTPVFSVGQLERSSMIRHFDTPNEQDQAQTFAEIYQAVLPLRIETPCLEIRERQPSDRTPKKLRKIKCQTSLRDLSEEQATNPPYSPPSSRPFSESDLETLLGSESPRSSTFTKYDDLHRSPFGESTPLSTTSSDNDVSLKMCIELLTNELASVLFQHHPSDTAGRASGLQILLMIESYETVQAHVRRQLSDIHVTDERMQHLEDVEGMLGHWLRVLYELYDRSVGRKSNEDLRDWELRGVEDSVPAYAYGL